MNLMHISRSGLLICLLITGCEDPYSSSGGGLGNPTDPSIDVSGTWTDTVYPFRGDANKPALVTIELIQNKRALTGSVEIPKCFPKAPVTSGFIQGWKNIDTHGMSFTARQGNREFTFTTISFSGPPIHGFCELTTDVPGCRSLGTGKVQSNDPEDIAAALCFATLHRRH